MIDTILKQDSFKMPMIAHTVLVLFVVIKVYCGYLLYSIVILITVFLEVWPLKSKTNTQKKCAHIGI